MLYTPLLAGLAGLAFAQNTATSTKDVAAAAATAKTSSPTSHVPGLAFDRMVIIWLENTDYDKAIGDPNLKALADKGITLSNYFGLTHPSEPNYVASHGGDYFGMNNDAFHVVPNNISSVTDLLESRGISWGAYQEHMPYSGFEGFSWVNQQTKANDYVRKHNPPVIYGVNENPQRLSQIKNFTMFDQDLKNNALPQWSFITPNMTDDGHDSSITVAGDWCGRFIPPLLEDKNFMQNTLVLLTFDENEDYALENRVLGILLGDAVPKDKVGTVDSNYYNHYSELATVEANWQLPTLGRWDVGANVFDLVGQRTGDHPRPNAAITGPNPTHFQNLSYAGPFNDDNPYRPFPAPNTRLVRNGRPVAPWIIAEYGFDKPTYYTDTVQVPEGMFPPKGYEVDTS